MPPLIFIAGPTASGKSRLAIALAKVIKANKGSKTDIEIVNADAIQVYRDLDILSARPTIEEQAGIGHHLFGYKDGAERCSAGIWAQQAAQTISEINERGAGVIMVGGTGLYFSALEQGLSPIPDIEESYRLEAKARYENLGSELFYDEVVGQDKAMARLAKADRQRLMRAWSVYRATGKPLSYFQTLPRYSLLSEDQRVTARMVLSPERSMLYERCNARYDQMVESGGLEEAQTLLKRGLSTDLPVMKALGAAELMSHLRAEISLADAIELAKRNTRRFAKRQMTWFNGQAKDWPQALDGDKALSSLCKQLEF